MGWQVSIVWETRDHALQQPAQSLLSAPGKLSLNPWLCGCPRSQAGGGLVPMPCGSKRALDARGAWLRGLARDPFSKRPFPPPAVPHSPPPADQLLFAAALTVTHPFLTCTRLAHWGILSAQTQEPYPVQVEASPGGRERCPQKQLHGNKTGQGLTLDTGMPLCPTLPSPSSSRSLLGHRLLVSPLRGAAPTSCCLLISTPFPHIQPSLHTPAPARGHDLRLSWGHTHARVGNGPTPSAGPPPTPTWGPIPGVACTACRRGSTSLPPAWVLWVLSH